MGIEGRFYFVLTKIFLSSLQNKFAGRPAAVLGGGPSLPDDMARLPAGCILIAVNHHAFHHCQPDFMVFNDAPEADPLRMAEIERHRAVLVSPKRASDVIFNVPVWTGFYSSNTAAWFALFLGCDPVILCGMDCYQGEVKYCHEGQGDEPSHHYPLDAHLRPWMEECRNSVPHPERLRAMSGPLVPLFGAYG